MAEEKNADPASEASLERLVQEINAAVGATCGDLWIENVRNNLGFISGAYNLPQLEQLTKPVLCLGAGPSAWENLDKLSDFRGEIITCERMVAEVLRRGITPKYVVTMDGSPVMANFLSEEIVQQNQEKMVLIFAVQAATKTIASWSGPKACFVGVIDDPNKPLSATRILMQLTNRVALQMGGNCGCTTWTIARALNAPRIILLGMDLAFKKGTPKEQLNMAKWIASLPGDTQQHFEDLHRGYVNRWNREVITDLTFIAFMHCWKKMGTMLPLHDTIQCSEYTILDDAPWIARYCTFAEYLATQDKPTKEVVAT